MLPVTIDTAMVRTMWNDIDSEIDKQTDDTENNNTNKEKTNNTTDETTNPVAMEKSLIARRSTPRNGNNGWHSCEKN